MSAAPGEDVGVGARRGVLRRVGRLLPAVGWTAFAQLLSSMSNLVISVAVGRAGGATLLGQFALAFTAYLLALGFQRSLISEPLMSLAAQEDRAVDRSALTTAVVFGLGVSVVTAAAGAVSGQTALYVLALAFPLLLLQDHLRFQAFQRQDPRRAAELDLLWLLATVAAWPLVVSSSSIVVPLLAWGGGAGLAVAYGVARARIRPAPLPQAGRWWAQDARRYGGALAVESTVHSVAMQGMAFGLAAVIGVSEFGRLRAGQILLGFAGTALVTFNVLVLPRLAARGGALTTRQAGGLCVLATVVSVVAVGASILVAPLLQRIFFGGQLDVGLGLLFGLGAVMVFGSTTAGLVLHMKALRRVGGYTLGRLIVAVVGVPPVLVAGAIGGLPAVVVMLAVLAGGYALSDSIAWHYARRAAARESALS